MADERLHQLLLPLDGAATPDETFSESLFAQIAPLALAAGRRDRTWHGRIVAAVRTAARPLPAPAASQMRTAILLATLLALLVALAAIVASRRPDPLQVVLGSEAVYRDLPAFDMTVGYSDGAVRRFRYDGADVARLDAVKGAYGLRPEGTYIVVDARLGTTVEWDPAGGTFLTSEHVSRVRPAYLLDLRWGADLRVPLRFTSACLTWEYVEETSVLQRPAHHVRCATGPHEEFWVDVATGIVLRSTAVPTEEDRVSLTGEVLELALGVPIDPATLVADVGSRGGALMPGGDKPFEPGVRVVTNRFTPAFAATPGQGWRSWGTADDIVGFARGPDWTDTDGAGVLVVRLIRVPDITTNEYLALAPGPEAVLEWIREHPYFDVGEVVNTHVGLLPAQSVSILEKRPPDFETSCPMPAPGDPAAICWHLFPWAGDGYWTYGNADHGATLTVLEVGGVTVTVFSWADGPDKEAHLAAVEALIESIEFLD